MNQPLRVRHRNTSLYVVVVLVGFLTWLVGLCLCVLQRDPTENMAFLMLLTWFMVSAACLLWMTMFLWRHVVEANAEGITLQGALCAKRIPWSGVELASWKDGLLTIRGSGHEIRMKGKYYNADEVAVLLRTISDALPPSVKMEN